MCPLGLSLLADVEPTKQSGPCWLNPSSFLCLWAGSPSTTKSRRSLEWINSIAGYGVLPEDTGDVTPLENFEPLDDVLQREDSNSRPLAAQFR